MKNRMYKHSLQILVAAVLLFLSPRCGDAQTWTKIQPVGPSPKLKAGAGFVFLPGKKEMILFGTPEIGKSVSGRIWRLILSNREARWQAELPLPDSLYGRPEMRSFHQLLYDPASDRVILYGGFIEIEGGCSDEVWLLINAGDAKTARWKRHLPEGGIPPGRRWFSAVYDTKSNRMLVVGGNSCTHFEFSDSWILTHANGLGGVSKWLRLSPTPWRLRHHSAAYDPMTNRMTVFGGNQVVGTGKIRSIRRKNHLWVFTNASNTDAIRSEWEKQSPDGTLPAPRDGHSAIYDQKRNRMMLFGGRSDRSLLNDLWILTHADRKGRPTWKKGVLKGDVPVPRRNAAMVFDFLTRRSFLYGGEGAEGPLFDLWMLSNADLISTRLSDNK